MHPLPPSLESQLRTLNERLPNFSEKQREAYSQYLAKIRWTQENEAIRFFTPHGGQTEFVRLIDGGFIIVSGAGNGWGKSEILAAIFAATMWPGLAPEALATPALQDWKFPKRARIYSKPAELESIGSLQTAIARLFPKGRYEVSKGRYSYPSVFTTDTGWVLDLFSYERHESEAAGPNIGLQAFNEPPPEPLWKEAVARSRAGGYILGGFTSLLDNVWIVDGLLGKHDGNDVRVRYGSSCENCREHGVNGSLEHKQIMRVLDQFDPEEREARFTGKPLSMSGRIFKGFDRNVHVAKEVIQPPDGGVTHYMAVDPAIGKPMFVVWSYVDAAGVVTVYDEYPDFKFEGSKDSNLTVADYAQMFKAKEKGRIISVRIIDRHFAAARRTPGGNTLKADFEEQGLSFQDSYSTDGEAEIETGIIQVRKFINYDKSKPLDSINRPRLVISPNCTNTIAAMERWARDPKTLKPMEIYKDGADCIRYIIGANPEVETVSTWKQRAPHFGVNNG